MFLTDNIEDIDIVQWEKLVDSSPTASFFSTKKCYDFYASLSFLNEFIFAVFDAGILKGIIVGYIQSEGKCLKRFLSRRAIIPAGAMLSADISEETLSVFLNYCKDMLHKKAIYIEFRNYNDYSLYKHIFQKEGYRYHAHLNFHVDCTSEEKIEKALTKSRKRDIRTSIREGAEIITDPSWDEVLQYYQILSDLYKYRVKTPLFPLEFFEQLYQIDESLFLLIRHCGKIIGGTVCVMLDKRIIYEWFVCGANENHKNVHPSTLATWGAINYSCKNGIPLFDMMGAGKPGDSYKVRDFKAKFGGKLVEYGRFLYVLNPALYGVGRLGVFILKKIK
jgi:lipid II:glycine glycyltransferase (peptidoglycan interpeptide bridge formation enzyme)